MEKIVDLENTKSVRNMNTAIALYDEMINKHNAMEAVNKYLVPEYIQHNQSIGTGAEALGQAFGYVGHRHPSSRVEIHRIIAAGDYVWSHVIFFNLNNDAPSDRGTAGVDILKFNEEGKIIEHWDVLQEIIDPSTAANTNGQV
ncbi:MAG: nuclear transport factor 2 family protein [Cytophagales bacterium]|nr:nuclear transport factor 2 family protein [Cytophagales bacterium]